MAAAPSQCALPRGAAVPAATAALGGQGWPQDGLSAILERATERGCAVRSLQPPWAARDGRSAILERATAQDCGVRSLQPP